MKEIKIGIIGCGSRIRGVAAAILRESPRITVTALSDPDKFSIQRARERLNPEAEVYKDYHDLVAAKDVDWVLVGSWNCFHKEHVVAAFQAGKNGRG